jgi:ribosomal-protein-alanine N-acetyltransferase
VSVAGGISHPVVRQLLLADLDEVVAIEQASYPYPWTRGIFEDCLKVGYACFGCILAGQLVGYSIQNWGVGEAHLLNLCVRPELRHRGLGRLMLDHAIDHAQRLDCIVMLLEVRPSNPRAIRLYRDRGFEQIGRRSGYYPANEGREDAIVMRLDLPAA